MSTSLIDAPAARRGLRRTLGALVAAGAMLAGAAFAAGPAYAASNNTIEGTLRDSGDSVVTYAWVTLVTSNDRYVDERNTEEEGTYSFDGLADGTYTLYTSGTNDRWQFLGGVQEIADATLITVSGGETKIVDFTTKAGQDVSGQIRFANGSGAESWVSIYRQRNVGGLTRWSYLEDRLANSNGTYEFGDVLPGTYTVWASGYDGFVGRYYGNVREEHSATTFPVTAAAGKTGVDLTLPLGATITGFVTAPDGTPAEAEVDLHEFWKDSFGFEYDDNYYDGTETNGQYSISGVDAGTYTLEFEDDNGERYPDQFLGGVTEIGGAERFSVKLGQVKTVNVKLTSKPAIAPSTTTIALSKSSRAYGSTSTATVSVSGVGASATGSVKLLDGTKTIGTKTLSSQKATFTLPANLSAGKHNLKAVYTSTGFLKSSTSAVKAFTVTKLASTTTATLSKDKSKLVVKVKATGTTPSGKVTIKDGKSTFKTVTLTSGKASVSLSSLKDGKHSLKAVYNGSSTVKGSSSAKVSVTR